jgi:hypothetical protein
MFGRTFVVSMMSVQVFNSWRTSGSKGCRERDELDGLRCFSGNGTQKARAGFVVAGPAGELGDSLTVFLAAIGSRIHMQGWRDGYYWNRRTARIGRVQARVR